MQTSAKKPVKGIASAAREVVPAIVACARDSGAYLRPGIRHKADRRVSLTTSRKRRKDPWVRASSSRPLGAKAAARFIERARKKESGEHLRGRAAAQYISLRVEEISVKNTAAE